MMSKAFQNQMARLGVIFAVSLATGSLLLAQDVKTTAKPGADFSKYKTYKWVEVKGAQKPNQIIDGEIVKAIDGQMATKGFTKTQDDNADLYVDYQAAVSQSQQWNSYSTGMGPGWGYGWYGGMGSTSTTTTSQTINTGTLQLDMYDRGAKELVWTGQASKTLGSGKNQEKVTKNINKAAAKLLKNFPPKPKG